VGIGDMAGTSKREAIDEAVGIGETEGAGSEAGAEFCGWFMFKSI
jgi:hypothetical protein